MIYGPAFAAARALLSGAPAAAAVPGATRVAAGAAGGLGAGELAAAFGAVSLGGAVGYMAYKGITKPTTVGDLRAQDLASAKASPKSIAAFGEPSDGFDAAGMPIAPRAADLAPARPSGPTPVYVTNPADLDRGYNSNLARNLSRPPSGPTGFDPTGSVPSYPSTSTPH